MGCSDAALYAEQYDIRVNKARCLYLNSSHRTQAEGEVVEVYKV